MPARPPVPPPLDAVLAPLPKDSGVSITTQDLVAKGPAVVILIRRPG
jgi:hypothetical protein